MVVVMRDEKILTYVLSASLRCLVPMLSPQSHLQLAVTQNLT